ncbi:hypothetical protein [Curtobacterium sp. SL109]|uniref:hypothetical protein n=1 Tax=Curtobacterium sp. SL109 TaxID=2994662 RepID=UPI0022727A55|nr:hypothetical protein [Curtobacterium sp. SL109]MCY1692874.1 hypothetical protein [Curtobacterium sp. SL109]
MNASGFDPNTPNALDMSKLVPALDAMAAVRVPTLDMARLIPALRVMADVKVPKIDTARLFPALSGLAGMNVPTIDIAKLMPALQAFSGIRVPTVDPSKFMPALTGLAGMNVPTIDTARLLPALDALSTMRVPTYDANRLRLLDGYGGRTGTRLDAVGSLYSSLEETQLLPHLDSAADALATRGALRWNYDEVQTAAGALVEDFQTLEPALQLELEARTEEARDALSVTNNQLEQSLDLLGVRDALRFYGAAARTPLATFAAVVVGSGWYLLSWGSAGDAIVVGAGVFSEVRRRLGALDHDE